MGNFPPDAFCAFALSVTQVLDKALPHNHSFDFYRPRGFESFLSIFKEFVKYLAFQNMTKRDNATFSGFLILFLTIIVWLVLKNFASDRNYGLLEFLSKRNKRGLQMAP